MNRLHVICLSAIFLSLPCFLWKAKADNAIDYSPGEISYQETISPTGGRIYTVPLLTTPSASSAPQISLLYNSQAGNGIAGYGWNIGGLSSITITNKNLYYHATVAPADKNCSSRVYSLDGNPILPVDESELALVYDYQTAQGNILVNACRLSSNIIKYFTVYYPDGSVATFGYPDNTVNLTTYPITSYEDKFGFTTNYIYDHSNTPYEKHLLLSIEYGHKDDLIPIGKVLFDYSASDRSDCIVNYYAGSKFCPNHLLKSVSSFDSENLLRKYTLKHTFRDGVNLLSEIECRSQVNGKSLRPLKFEYGESSDLLTQDFTYDGMDFLIPGYTSDSTYVQYHRGKFLQGDYNDGLVLYPSLSPYMQLGKYKWGSSYATNDTIKVLPSLSGENIVCQQLLTGSGFQRAVPVDVNGDGKYELVMINYKVASTQHTALTISVYAFDENQSQMSFAYSFDVTVSGAVVIDGHISPMKYHYEFGDFKGDGTNQLLIIGYDHIPGIEESYSSHISIVDIANRTEISESELFSFSDPSEVLCVDIDGDGRTELCHSNDPDLNVYNLNGSAFSLSKTIALHGDIIADKYLVGNVNGDSYIDIIVPPSISEPYYEVFCYNGDSFDYMRTSSSTVPCENDRYTMYDLNNDGLDDIVQRCGLYLSFKINNNGSYNNSAWISSSVPVSSDLDFIQCTLVDYDSSSDFYTVEDGYIRRYSFSSDSRYNRILSKFTNSLGKVSMNQYKDMVDSEDVYQNTNHRIYDFTEGYINTQFPLPLLYQSISYQNELMSDSDIIEKIQYSYSDACSHLWGLGFCGFGEVRTVDLNNTPSNQKVVIETRDPEYYGVITSISTSFTDSPTMPYYTVSYTYGNDTTMYGKYNPRLIKTYSRDNLTANNILTRYYYGKYDYPEKVEVRKTDDNANLVIETQDMTYSHHIGASSQILGVLTSVTNTRCINNDYWYEKQCFNTFNSKMQPEESVSSVGSILSDMNQVEKTEYSYDSYGHIIAEKKYLFNSSVPNQKSFTYNSDKITLESATDELGHTIVYGDYDIYRQPQTITDYKGRITRNRYDSWGNLTSRTYPDGSRDSTLIQFGGDGVYTVTTMSSGKPSQIMHYDSAGRIIKSGQQSLTGEWIYKETEYDSNGMVMRESLPYKDYASATLWNTYSYDKYLRPVLFTKASGNITRWNYNQNSTTETNNGIWSNKTYDLDGNLIRVEDEGGAIYYTYRIDGNPSQVSVSGAHPLVFNYDEYGRRIAINDPSAGTQTDTTSYDSNGCSLSIHTNPNGTIKIYRDRLGRTTKIERFGLYVAEYNTEYTYNSDGLLVEEESTNGTSKTYTYDSYDRISTLTEVVPDGKWLRKEYTYTGDGNLLSIHYISQSVLIDGEYFYYQNGYNYKITNAQGATIRQINSVNEFGQPTSVRTGTINRTYSYSPYGLPTRRTMGNVMDVSYEFDTTTGNLTYRDDNLQMCYEEFGYDALNRLDYMDADMRTVTYSPHGNITHIDGVGDLEYNDGQHPYQITSLSMEDDVASPRFQNVSYTSYSRPSYLNEGNRTARLTYNGDGDRVKMNIADGVNTVLSRYYIGNQYEIDVKPSGTVERLYLGGDAYSAPMVYIKEGDGEWEMYNIGRDYLGSITHIATANGTLIEENSYDPWGRLRIPGTTTVYPFGSEPELMLGRGYTGHEHLTWFGVINMNARLYDPVLGRFLSPDPFVQIPDFTQNFNRYSYCLNNPL